MSMARTAPWAHPCISSMIFLQGSMVAVPLRRVRLRQLLSVGGGLRAALALLRQVRHRRRRRAPRHPGTVFSDVVR